MFADAMKLYTDPDLVSWYRLVDPWTDHADEAAVYSKALRTVATGSTGTLLELGSGAGGNAAFLKKDFRCTLVDPSARMLELSRELNPECEHLAGDMRDVRLGRAFDAVFVHDAIAYMRTKEDLLAAMTTAFDHTRPGGVAVFAPDFVRECFSDQTQLLERDEGDRSMRGIEWCWDPNPNDDAYRVDYVFTLRERGEVRVIHDTHEEGLFPRETWRSTMRAVGFDAEIIEKGLGEPLDQIFVGRRPLR